MEIFLSVARRSFSWLLTGWLWKANVCARRCTLQSAEWTTQCAVTTLPRPPPKWPLWLCHMLPLQESPSLRAFHLALISILQKPNPNVTWSLEPPQSSPHRASGHLLCSPMTDGPSCLPLVAVLPFFLILLCPSSRCLDGARVYQDSVQDHFPSSFLHVQNILNELTLPSSQIFIEETENINT